MVCLAGVWKTKINIASVWSGDLKSGNNVIWTSHETLRVGDRGAVLPHWSQHDQEQVARVWKVAKWGTGNGDFPYFPHFPHLDEINTISRTVPVTGHHDPSTDMKVLWSIYLPTGKAYINKVTLMFFLKKKKQTKTGFILYWILCFATLNIRYFTFFPLPCLKLGELITF